MRNRVLGRAAAGDRICHGGCFAAKPYSPRVYFLLNAPFEVQRRAKQIAVDWQGWITWRADAVLGDGEAVSQLSVQG
jgi:hypothetical protein